MAVNDLYQIVDKSHYLGQEVDNIYFYKQAAALLTGNVAEQVANSYITDVLPAIAIFQVDGVTHEEIIVTNLFNPSEVHTELISVSGGALGEDGENPFTAIGFRLVQDNGGIRNGAKRYSGIGEGVDTDGVISAAPYIALLAAAGVALFAGLDAGIVANAFLPVVVKRILDGSDYRLPTNSGEAVTGVIVDALYNLTETSQVSRKVGRGV